MAQEIFGSHTISIHTFTLRHGPCGLGFGLSVAEAGQAKRSNVANVEPNKEFDLKEDVSLVP